MTEHEKNQKLIKTLSKLRNMRDFYEQSLTDIGKQLSVVDLDDYEKRDNLEALEKYAEGEYNAYREACAILQKTLDELNII